MKCPEVCRDCPRNTARHNFNSSRGVMIRGGAIALSTSQKDIPIPVAVANRFGTFPPVVVHTPDDISDDAVALAFTSCNEKTRGFRDMNRLRYLGRRLLNTSRETCVAMELVEPMQQQLDTISDGSPSGQYLGNLIGIDADPVVVLAAIEATDQTATPHPAQ